ncbi:hypothetical protein Ahy_A06g027502 [Arachis hypogaea]|uniref:Uncharacterized protein n=1 Tax=Arachis hypogaea TaxID=3818 RepID=A0A445CNV8_ARAHY|nr:hypothetical protein Ahy_A06g027502 [Arachis hypogaea]
MNYGCQPAPPRFQRKTCPSSYQLLITSTLGSDCSRLRLEVANSTATVTVNQVKIIVMKHRL